MVFRARSAQKNRTLEAATVNRYSPQRLHVTVLRHEAELWRASADSVMKAWETVMFYRPVLWITGVILLLTGIALPARIAVSEELPEPNCPQINGSHNWRDYFLRRYNNLANVYVKLDVMKGNIGTLSANDCLSVGYWSGVWHAGTHPPGGQPHQGVGIGDPNQYFMNLWGHMFQYNEAGELYDVSIPGQYQSIGLVGHLYCRNICPNWGAKR
jgi:hypothetical protein